jgi:hypothetical protein
MQKMKFYGRIGADFVLAAGMVAMYWFLMQVIYEIFHYGFAFR